MAKLLDWDPLRGLQQLEDKTIDGKLQIHYRQDVEPVLELAKYERINGLADKAGKEGGQDIYLYARIPPVVQLEMKYKHGVDIMNRDHMKKAFYLINTEYPHLRCTEKKHWLKN
jgi:hypothetical protein